MYKLNALYGLNKRDDYEAFQIFQMDCMVSIYSEVTKVSLIMNVLYSY